MYKTIKYIIVNYAVNKLANYRSDFNKDEYLAKVKKISSRIERLQDYRHKEYQLEDVKSAVSTIEVETIELKSQFRCNGSDDYLDWIDDIVYKGRNYVEEHNIKFGDEYEFDICDTPAELERKIRSLNSPKDNEKQIARFVAGYCWTWSQKLQENGDLYRDVVIGDWLMPWETNNVQARKPYNEK